MRRTLLLLLIAVMTALTAIAVMTALTATASVNANGKTYVPATASTMKTPNGTIPEVRLPAKVPYYATRPPTGQYAQVYSQSIKYVVWVSLAAAVSHQWYVAKPAGISAGWLTVAFIAIGGALSVTYLTRRKVTASNR